MLDLADSANMSNVNGSRQTSWEANMQDGSLTGEQGVERANEGGGDMAEKLLQRWNMHFIQSCHDLQQSLSVLGELHGCGASLVEAVLATHALMRQGLVVKERRSPLPLARASLHASEWSRVLLSLASSLSIPVSSAGVGSGLQCS